MSAEDAVLDYYEALRRGEPLYPYFVESPDTHKVAVSTAYDGYEAVAAALREQTRTTTDWVVDSEGPSVVAGDEWASFHDDVSLAWTTTDAPDRDDAGGSPTADAEGSPPADAGGNRAADAGGNRAADAGGSPPAEDGVRHEFETRWSGTLVERDGEWLFLELHVSAPSAV